MSKKHSVGNTIFSGIGWMLVQTAGSKVSAILGQIILAWLLEPADFGLISLVYTVTSLGLIIQQFGLNDVLVRRQRSFDKWLPLAFGISWVFGIFSCILLLVLGFAGSKVYHDDRIFTLVAFYAFTTPLDAISVIPLTKLRIDLNFRALSVLRVSEAFLTMFLTVILAWIGLGVYSFAIPPLIVSIVLLIVRYRISHLDVIYKVHLKRWKYLTLNSTWSLVHSITQKILDQGTYAILGLMVSKSVVGIYYMAYSLSMQVIGFVANNLPQVLFPSLAAIREADKAKDIFKRSVTYLSVFGAAFAIWQGATAEWLVRLFFSDKWLPTIPLVEILSVGMAFRAVAWLWSTPFRLKGKFAKMAHQSIISLACMIVMVTIATMQWGVTGAAVALSVFFMIGSPIRLYEGYKLLDGTLGETLAVFITPVTTALVSYGVFWYLFKYRITHLSAMASFIIVSVAGSLLYMAGIYLFMRGTFNELKGFVINKLPGSAARKQKQQQQRQELVSNE